MKTGLWGRAREWRGTAEVKQGTISKWNWLMEIFPSYGITGHMLVSFSALNTGVGWDSPWWPGLFSLCIRACSSELDAVFPAGLVSQNPRDLLEDEAVQYPDMQLPFVCALSCRGSAVSPRPSFFRKHKSMSCNPLATLWRTWPCPWALLLSSRTFSALCIVLIISTRLSSDFWEEEEGIERQQAILSSASHHPKGHFWQCWPRLGSALPLTAWWKD